MSTPNVHNLGLEWSIGQKMRLLRRDTDSITVGLEVYEDLVTAGAQTTHCHKEAGAEVLPEAWWEGIL